MSKDKIQLSEIKVRMFFDWDDVEAALEMIDRYIADAKTELAGLIDPTLDVGFLKNLVEKRWYYYLTRMRPPRYKPGYGPSNAKAWKKAVERREKVGRDILFRKFRPICQPAPVDRSILFRRFERITYPYVVWMYVGYGLWLRQDIFGCYPDPPKGVVVFDD